VGNKNFIIINGKKYDTVTGKLLQENSNISKNTQHLTKPLSNTGVVDGFVRKPAKKSRPVTAQHNVKHTQKSQTLMRQVVKKPNTTVSPKQGSKPTIQKSHLGVSHRRSEIAKQTPKSQQIHKFGTIQHRTSVVKSSVALDVAKAPTTNNHSMSKIDQPSNKKPAYRASAAEKMIEAALTNAGTHSEDHTPKKKKRNKILKKLGISAKAAGMSSAILAGVLLGGFFAVQNVPNLSMRVAAARAGFDAQMPGYQPSGFSFKGPINYTTGKVTVSFESNSDEREYKVTQQASNWNSDALLSNYVVAGNKQYQTYLDRGRTLYIYDGSNATWVDNGVWYTVEGDSEMTTDQLIRIAASI
jgi:hypothetical protein